MDLFGRKPTHSHPEALAPDLGRCPHAAPKVTNCYKFAKGIAVWPQVVLRAGTNKPQFNLS